MYQILFNSPESPLKDFSVERDGKDAFDAIANARADYPDQRWWRVTAVDLTPRDGGSCAL